jgi:hypothetical protein
VSCPRGTGFEQFRRLAGVKVEHRPGKWVEHLEAAIAYRQTLGLSAPTDHPTIVGGRQNRKPVRARGADCRRGRVDGRGAVQALARAASGNCFDVSTQVSPCAGTGQLPWALPCGMSPEP